MAEQTASVLVGSLQKFSLEDGPGIRTTIFFKGCPLDCKWCHNPELIAPSQELMQSPNNCIGCGACVESCPNTALSMDATQGIVVNRDLCKVCLTCVGECYAQALRPVAKAMTIDEMLNIAQEDKAFYDKTGGGITLSGGEVLSHHQFACDLVEEAAKKGLTVCIDTCGYGNTEGLMALAEKKAVTHILYDIKAMDDAVHMAYTGVSNALILENVRKLAQNPHTASKVILRMPLLQGINDSMEMIASAAAFYKTLGLTKVHLLLYHGLGIGKKKNIGGMQEEFTPPSEERVAEIEEYFKNMGMCVEVFGRLSPDVTIEKEI